MKLLALQGAFQAHVLGDDNDIADQVEIIGGVGAAERLHVYHHAYRARLGGVLREAFDRTWSWLGDDAFNAAVAAYIAQTPSSNSSLDDYAAGFPDFIAARLPHDAESAELAWLERAMRHVFDGPDAAPLDPAPLAALSADAWDSARLRLHPTMTMRSVSIHIGALWSAIEAREAFMPPRLEASSAVRVWRKGLKPHFRMIGAVEHAALRQLADGARFAALCETLARSFDDDPVALVAGLLGVWLEDQLIVGIDV